MSSTQVAPNERVETILRAALRVIGRGGALGVRMAAVAEQAGVSKALVHYYFTTRQELLRAAFAFASKELSTLLAERFAASSRGRDKLEVVLLSLVDAEPPHADFHVIWNELWSTTQTDDELKPLVKNAYLDWIGWVREGVLAAAGDGELPLERAEEITWRLTALADGVQSLLYADVVDRAGGVEILRTALARELLH